jgi:hypothetical protein
MFQAITFHNFIITHLLLAGLTKQITSKERDQTKMEQVACPEA